VSQEHQWQLVEPIVDRFVVELNSGFELLELVPQSRDQLGICCSLKTVDLITFLVDTARKTLQVSHNPARVVRSRSCSACDHDVSLSLACFQIVEFVVHLTQPYEATINHVAHQFRLVRKDLPTTVLDLRFLEVDRATELPELAPHGAVPSQLPMS
jgi:hypothetical protein